MAHASVHLFPFNSEYLDFMLNNEKEYWLVKENSNSVICLKQRKKCGNETRIKKKVFEATSFQLLV